MAEQSLQLVTFHIGDEEFGIDIPPKEVGPAPSSGTDGRMATARAPHLNDFLGRVNRNLCQGKTFKNPQRHFFQNRVICEPSALNAMVVATRSGRDRQPPGSSRLSSPHRVLGRSGG